MLDFSLTIYTLLSLPRLRGRQAGLLTNHPQGASPFSPAGISRIINLVYSRLSFTIQEEGDHSAMTFDDLYQAAKAVLNPRKLSEFADAGGVGAALLSESGRVYTGVCIDTACSMGFCAEHAAAAAMITAGENRVLKMVAVGTDGRVMPPCGRCREFISQLHDDNIHTEVMVRQGVIVSLQELLPYDWRKTEISGRTLSP